VRGTNEDDEATTDVDEGVGAALGACTGPCGTGRDAGGARDADGGIGAAPSVCGDTGFVSGVLATKEE
jgi:hypothetical protein